MARRSPQARPAPFVPPPAATLDFAGVWVIVQALSLDVVAGASCGAMLAAYLSQTAPPWIWWWLVPAATWVVYSTDRLFDARVHAESSRFLRHRFYYRHARPLRHMVGAATLLASVAAVVWMPTELLPAGCVLGAATVGYLWLVQRCRSRWFPKELSAAVIYTAAIWYVPVSLAAAPERLLLPIALHLLAALANLTLYAMFEADGDRLENHASIVQSWGARAAGRVLWAITVGGSVLALAGWFAGPAAQRPACGVLWIVLVVPWSMARAPLRFRPHARYRLLGDAVFLLLAVPSLIAGAGA